MWKWLFSKKEPVRVSKTVEIDPAVEELGRRFVEQHEDFRNVSTTRYYFRYVDRVTGIEIIIQAESKEVSCNGAFTQTEKRYLEYCYQKREAVFKEAEERERRKALMSALSKQFPPNMENE